MLFMLKARTCTCISIETATGGPIISYLSDMFNYLLFSCSFRNSYLISDTILRSPRILTRLNVIPISTFKWKDELPEFFHATLNHREIIFLLIIYLLSVGIFLSTVRRTECGRCVYRNCPANCAPDETSDQNIIGHGPIPTDTDFFKNRWKQIG